MKITSISDIYPIYDEIKFSDTFLSDLTKRRKKRYVIDKSLLALPVKNIDIENLDEIPEGKLACDYKEAHIECFFKKGKRKKLFVMLKGARSSLKEELPRYSRWTYYMYSDCYLLSIEDPMYYKYPDLHIGWYYGTKEANFREYIVKFVEKVATCCDIEKENVVFFGSSAGGTAAIHCAQIFGGGVVAVSINPQLNFEYNHENIPHFKANTGINLHEKDVFNRNDFCSIIQNGADCKFILIENCKSSWDYEHLTYICNKLKVSPSLGIEQFDNLITWIYEANYTRPHIAFEDRNIFVAIDFLTELVVCNENLDRYKPLYQLIGEFWFEKYAQEGRIVNAQKAGSVIKLSSKVFNMQSFECILKEQTLNLHTDKDKLYYRFNNLECNTIYNIVLRGLENALQDGDVSIGIWDNVRHAFYEKCSVKTGENDYTFAIRGINKDMSLCIAAAGAFNFPLNIGSLEIYKHSLLDI